MALASVSYHSSLFLSLLVQRQIGDGTTEPGILCLEFLHPLDLIRLQPAEFLPPAVIRGLGHTDSADSIRDGFAL